MSKGKASEKEMIGVLKQIEAGQTAAGVTRGAGVPSTPPTRGESS